MIQREHGHLPYPEGTACAHVLVASEIGGAHARNVFYGLAGGAFFKVLTSWAKVKNEQLKSEQLEKYLDLAKEFGIDALITISNQFATTPSHHPASVDKRKLKSVELYHFSWLSFLSNAQLLSESDAVTDREQAMVLKELIRFLEHDHSGVQPFDRMGPR